MTNQKEILSKKFDKIKEKRDLLFNEANLNKLSPYI